MLEFIGNCAIRSYTYVTNIPVRREEKRIQEEAKQREASSNQRFPKGILLVLVCYPVTMTETSELPKFGFADITRDDFPALVTLNDSCVPHVNTIPSSTSIVLWCIRLFGEKGLRL